MGLGCLVVLVLVWPGAVALANGGIAETRLQPWIQSQLRSLSQTDPPAASRPRAGPCHQSSSQLCRSIKKAFDQNHLFYCSRVHKSDHGVPDECFKQCFEVEKLLVGEDDLECKGIGKSVKRLHQVVTDTIDTLVGMFENKLSQWPWKTNSKPRQPPTSSTRELAVKGITKFARVCLCEDGVIRRLDPFCDEFHRQHANVVAKLQATAKSLLTTDNDPINREQVGERIRDHIFMEQNLPLVLLEEERTSGKTASDLSPHKRVYERDNLPYSMLEVKAKLQDMGLLAREGVEWPGGLVPYTVDGLTLTLSTVVKLGIAMHEIEATTCVQFFEVSPKASVPKVLVQGKEQGCSWTRAPKARTSGVVNLFRDDCGTGSIIHELLHALGFAHLQERMDRDKYIKIQWSNIKEDFKNQWTVEKSSWEAAGLSSFDYYSIMMYSRFKKNKRNESVALFDYVGNPVLDEEDVKAFGDCLTTDCKQRSVLRKSDSTAVNLVYCKRSKFNCAEYRGTRAVTRSGASCLTWPKKWHNPDKEVGDHNFCRNPDNYEGAWCFTKLSSAGVHTWELCDVDCECKQPDKSDYRGTQMRTKNGTACIKWSAVEEKGVSTPIHMLTHPHAGLSGRKGHSYCRNPDNKPGGAWCYTSNVSWGYCDVECGRTTPSVAVQHPGLSKSFTHNGKRIWYHDAPWATRIWYRLNAEQLWEWTPDNPTPDNPLSSKGNNKGSRNWRFPPYWNAVTVACHQGAGVWQYNTPAEANTKIIDGLREEMKSRLNKPFPVRTCVQCYRHENAIVVKTAGKCRRKTIGTCSNENECEKTTCTGKCVCAFSGWNSCECVNDMSSPRIKKRMACGHGRIKNL